MVGFGYCSMPFLFPLSLSLRFFISLMIDHFRIERHSFILNDDHRQKLSKRKKVDVQSGRTEEEEEISVRGLITIIINIKRESCSSFFSSLRRSIEIKT